MNGMLTCFPVHFLSNSSTGEYTTGAGDIVISPVYINNAKASSHITQHISIGYSPSCPWSGCKQEKSLSPGNEIETEDRI